jgi:hypothetical protein
MIYFSIMQEDGCGPMLDPLWTRTCTCRRCTVSARCSLALSLMSNKVIQLSDTDWSRSSYYS